MVNIKIISASAGSGKTYSLTREIVDMIKTGINPEAFIVTTFTNKAAAELRERIRLRLLEENWDGDVNRIGDSFIGTVNSICGRLLKEYAIDAGKSPALRIMPEEDSGLIFKKSIEAIIEKNFATIEPVAKRLNLSGGNPSRNEEDWRFHVKQVVDFARSNGIKGTELTEMAANSWKIYTEFLEEPTSKNLDEKLLLSVEIAIKNLKDLDSNVKKTKGEIEKLEKHLRSLKGGRVDWSEWVRLTKIDPEKKAAHIVEPVITAAKGVLKHQKFHDDLKNLIEKVFNCAKEALEAYEKYKTENGLMDFVDQEADILEMALNNDAFKSSIKDRVSLLMVDEFQDTSPIQLALFLALNELAGSSIWVGDSKQAIYAFRGTDPKLMGDVIAEAGDVAILDYSWRSKEKLVHFVNDVFSKVFHELGEEKVKLKIPESRIEKAKGGQLETWHLQAKNKDEDDLAIANGVKDLLKREQNLRPGDIAILCRKNGTCKSIAATLGNLGIQTSIGNGRLIDTREIKLVLAALKYMNNKNHSLALAELMLLSDADNDWYFNLIKNPGEARLKWEKTAIAINLSEGYENIKFFSPMEALEEAIARSKVLDIIKSWPSSKIAIKNLEMLKAACNTYMETCSFNRRAATIEGFLAYLEDAELEKAAEISENAVNILTYHGSKGLEWPWVILTELGTEPTVGFFGVKIEAAECFNPAQPLANRKILYLPWPFGAAKTFEPFDNKVKNTDLYKRMEKENLQEEQRLLYVGITRAEAGLAFALRKKVTKKSGETLETKGLDLLKDDRGSSVVALETTLNQNTNTTNPVNVTVGDAVAQFNVFTYDLQVDKTSDFNLVRWDEEYVPKYPTEITKYLPGRISPSTFNLENGDYVNYRFQTIANLGDRVKIKGKPEMDVLGNAIHGYLGIEYINLSPEQKLNIASIIIKQWGIEDKIDSSEVVRAGDVFSEFLNKRYENFKTYKEWPISVRNEHNQIIQGWMDLLLETDSGYVVIDHKSYPGKDPEERMKMYIPQLLKYKEAVEKVIKKEVVEIMIHLPIIGEVLSLNY